MFNRPATVPQRSTTSFFNNLLGLLFLSSLAAAIQDVVTRVLESDDGQSLYQLASLKQYEVGCNSIPNLLGYIANECNVTAVHRVVSGAATEIASYLKGGVVLSGYNQTNLETTQCMLGYFDAFVKNYRNGPSSGLNTVDWVLIAAVIVAASALLLVGVAIGIAAGVSTCKACKKPSDPGSEMGYLTFSPARPHA